MKYRLVISVIFFMTIIAGSLYLVFQPEAARKKDAPEVINDKAAQVAIVLDDFGYTTKNLEYLRGLDIPVTLAVLPNVPYSRAVAAFAGENNFEAILHLPMEPENEEKHIEKDTIEIGMDAGEVEKAVKRALDNIPGARGVSNHMGSRATKDEKLMSALFNILKERRLFFLDSLTTAESICGKIAGKIGIPCVERDVFIDNEMNEEYIKNQLETVKTKAFAGKTVIAIGHDRGVTMRVLKKIVPEMKKEGVKFIFLSEAVRQNAYIGD